MAVSPRSTTWPPLWTMHMTAFPISISALPAGLSAPPLHFVGMHARGPSIIMSGSPRDRSGRQSAPPEPGVSPRRSTHVHRRRPRSAGTARIGSRLRTTVRSNRAPTQGKRPFLLLPRAEGCVPLAAGLGLPVPAESDQPASSRLTLLTSTSLVSCSSSPSASHSASQASGSPNG